MFFLAYFILLTSFNPVSNYEEAGILSHKPTYRGYWENSPAIFLCGNSPVSESRVRKAVTVWKRLGYSMSGVFVDPENPGCVNGTYSRGNIVIDLNGQDFPADKAAITKLYQDKYTHEIVGARIEIKEKWATTERVLEHEFGHAFGWNHFNRKLHLMNPIHDFGGWDTYGLRNVTQISSISPLHDRPEEIKITEFHDEWR